MRLLIVEDNEELAQLLANGLKNAGYDSDVLLTASDARAALATTRYAAVILDLGLPDGDGLSILREVRHRNDPIPVLVLTARGNVDDRVSGLRSGADDYLVKPFALEELLARLRALLRRASAPADDDDAMKVADLTLDPATRVVKRGDRLIELTRTEFNLLELLMRNAGQVLTRELIFDRVWGYDFGANSNSLEVYIGYLRRKTEADGEPRLIHTVRGVGYVLRESPTGA